ncbi:hypothetical protein GCM10007877_24590 [Marinibactrum halimedae]|uniref:PilZ domain-containing protein n=2 Tax=Marinibactrum halimedae TaxID=1444977 RepID=A0AA37TAB3_9GAMM|nr:hypothetical protein GCM10007877_24590 [Marinibactrum halimedae]
MSDDVIQDNPINDNRRQSYRIETKAIVDVKVLADQVLTDQVLTDNESINANPHDYFLDSANIQLTQEYRELQQQALKRVKALSDDHPELGEYAMIVQKQLDVLVQACLSNSADQQQTTTVNLSPTGLAFSREKPLAMGTLLALRFTLLPEYRSICCFAKVTRCEQILAQSFEIGGQFINIDEHQQHIISRHMMQAEREQRRKKTDQTEGMWAERQP